VAWRNLIVRHRYSDDGPGDAFGCDEGPWSAVAAGIEPRAVVKGVVAPSVDEEIEVHARGVRARTVGHDDDPRRRGQGNWRRRWHRDADVDTDIHLRRGECGGDREPRHHERDRDEQRASPRHMAPPFEVVPESPGTLGAKQVPAERSMISAACGGRASNRD